MTFYRSNVPYKPDATRKVADSGRFASPLRAYDEQVRPVSEACGGEAVTD